MTLMLYFYTHSTCDVMTLFCIFSCTYIYERSYVYIYIHAYSIQCTDMCAHIIIGTSWMSLNPKNNIQTMSCESIDLTQPLHCPTRQHQNLLAQVLLLMLFVMLPGRIKKIHRFREISRNTRKHNLGDCSWWTCCWDMTFGKNHIGFGPVRSKFDMICDRSCMNLLRWRCKKAIVGFKTDAGATLRVSHPTE